MRRARRQTFRRGNVSGTQRRRALRLVREIEARYGCVHIYPRETPGRMRDARRLHEAGMAVGAVAKREWGVGRIKELALFADVKEARRRYSRTIMPGLRSA